MSVEQFNHSSRNSMNALRLVELFYTLIYWLLTSCNYKLLNLCASPYNV